MTEKFSRQKINPGVQCRKDVGFCALKLTHSNPSLTLREGRKRFWKKLTKWVYPTKLRPNRFRFKKMIAKRRWRKRLRTHGFRARMQTPTGRRVLAARRKKGRSLLSVAPKANSWN